LAVGILTAARIPFGVFFTCAGGVQALIIALLAFQKFPDMHADPEPKADAGRSAAAASPWKRALFWALVASMFLYVGVELTYNGWIAEYAARHRAFGAAAAAGTVSIFWTGLLIGRILLSVKAKGKRQERLLALLALGSVVFYALTTLASSARGEASTPILQGLTWACAFLTGLFFSGCYPIIVSILGSEFGGSTVALGICSAAAGAGVLLFPLATGALASSIGLPLAIFLAACVDACLAILAISIAFKRRSS
jgi:MFS transporter, FHS family, glucose/mannose:H+ symporter